MFAHGSSICLSWVSVLIVPPHGSAMGLRWVDHELNHGSPTGRPWIDHGLTMGRPQVNHGSPTGRIWWPIRHPRVYCASPWVVAHGSRMDHAWVAHGSCMGRAWVVRGSRMGRPWVSHGFTVFAYGSPMGLSWWPMGLPSVCYSGFLARGLWAFFQEQLLHYFTLL